MILKVFLLSKVFLKLTVTLLVENMHAVSFWQTDKNRKKGLYVEFHNINKIIIACNAKFPYWSKYHYKIVSNIVSVVLIYPIVPSGHTGRELTTDNLFTVIKA